MKSDACPICGKDPEKSYQPFCSKRCADIDLGRWLDGGYAVPGEDAEHAENNPSGDESGLPH